MHCLVGINQAIWQKGNSSATFEKGIHRYALLSTEATS